MTILIVVFLNLLNPSEQAGLAHKTFPTEAACVEASKQLPEANGIRVSAFCVKASDLVS